MSAFEELGVMPEIIQSLNEMSWHLPTPVQTEAVPLILGGGDVAVAAETGSGKTGAFCIPILQITHESRTIPSPESSFVKAEAASSPKLSAVDCDRNIEVSDTGDYASCDAGKGWQGVRGTRGVNHGKWFYVASVSGDGLCRLGWGASTARLNLGTDRLGFGYGGTAKKAWGGKFDNYGQRFGNGDKIVCMLAIEKNDKNKEMLKIEYAKNDQHLGIAYEMELSKLGLNSISLKPAVSLKNATVHIDMHGGSDLAKSLGYQPIGNATFEDGMERQTSGEKKAEYSNSNRNPVALILEPSRELAAQVEEELGKMDQFLEKDVVNHILITGGGNPKAEKSLLRNGIDIVTGTLGSILRHVKKGSLSLKDIKFFVLDEADTFATDNLKDVLFLHEKVPPTNGVQTLLFSATLHSPEIKKLSEKIQAYPTWVDLKGKEAVPETVHHTLVRVDADSDSSVLADSFAGIEWPLDEVHIREREKKDKNDNGDAEMVDAADIRSEMIKKLKLVALKRVIDANKMNQAMIFVRTKLDADNAESFLLQCSGVPTNMVEKRRFRGRRSSGPEMKYSCSVLHGGRRQQERNEALAAFKEGEVRFIICTDVAARGIDIVGLPFLINITLPDKTENYIHRVGRVGRAERFGLAISLVAAQKEAVWFHKCKQPKNGKCKNRKLLSAGGCVMWYNEEKLLAEIEQRLKGPVEELGNDFKRKQSKAIAYGTRAGEEDISAATAKRINALKPEVAKLMKMEEDAQNLFFSMRSPFGYCT